MPVTSSAKKALRRDKRRQAVNIKVRSKMRTLIAKFKLEKDSGLLPQVYSAIDKAAKKHIIHKNKAARLKSQLNQMAKESTKTPKKATKKKTQKAASKETTKKSTAKKTTKKATTKKTTASKKTTK